jgi:hypothetical protein
MGLHTIVSKRESVFAFKKYLRTESYAPFKFVDRLAMNVSINENHNERVFLVKMKDCPLKIRVKHLLL